MSELKTISFKEVTISYLLELNNKADTLLSQTEITLSEVHKTYIDVRDTRVKIEKMGKSMRDTATEYSREVKKQENELLGYIQSCEESLKSKKDELEYYSKVDANYFKLEPRKTKLLEYLYILPEEEYEEIILMSEPRFEKLLEDKKSIYLKNKEKELAKKEAEIEKRKAVEEAIAKTKVEVKEEIVQQQEQQKIADKIVIDTAIDNLIKPINDKEQVIKENLKRLGFNIATDKYKEANGVYTVYRILGTFKA